MLSEIIVTFSDSSDSQYHLNSDQPCSYQSSNETSKMGCGNDLVGLSKKSDEINACVDIVKDLTEMSTNALPSESPLHSDTDTIQTPTRSIGEIQIQSTPISRTRRSRMQQTPTRNTTPRRQLKSSIGVGILRASRYCQKTTLFNKVKPSSVGNEVGFGAKDSALFQSSLIENDQYEALPPSKKFKSTACQKDEPQTTQTLEIVKGQETIRIECLPVDETYDISTDHINKTMIKYFSVPSHGSLVRNKNWEI
jgi:hypothetical protein